MKKGRICVQKPPAVRKIKKIIILLNKGPNLCPEASGGSKNHKKTMFFKRREPGAIWEGPISLCARHGGQQVTLRALATLYHINPPIRRVRIIGKIYMIFLIF